MVGKIKFVIPPDEKRAVNDGLRLLISYIGNQEQLGSHLHYDNNVCYKWGKSFINKKLGKWHNKAIENLVCAKEIELPADGKKRCQFYCWKLHRVKSTRILNCIQEIAASYNNEMVRDLFTELLEYIQNKMDTSKQYSYSEILTLPYRNELRMKLLNQDYSSDAQTIRDILDAIDAFDSHLCSTEGREQE